MQPDPTATLVIAVISLALSASALTWQVVQFLLSGRRVKVDARLAAIRPGSMVTAPTGADIRQLAGQGFTQLGLAVIARNLGRAPAQVDGYSIEFGSRASFTQPGMAINPQLPHTLDPGAKATFFIPMEGVRAASMLGGKGKAVKYRATVSLGTGQVKYSAWDTKPLPDDGT